jgi:hypothetical protein
MNRVVAALSVVGVIAGCVAAPPAAAAARERVELPDAVSCGRQQGEAANAIAVERVARRLYPQLAGNVGRIDLSSVVTHTARSKVTRTCAFDVEINDGALQLALRSAPPNLSTVAVAGLLRYVRDGAPIAGTSQEAVKASTIFLDLIDKNGGHAISLPSLHEQFRDLTFNRIGLCPVVDGATDFASPSCKVVLNYNDAVTSVIEGVRALAPVAQTFNSPELMRLDRCGGVIVVGELAAAVSPSDRRALEVSVQVSAVDYKDKTDLLDFKNTYAGQIRASGGGRTALEESLVVDAITAAVNELAQKVVRSGHYGKCDRS